MSKDLQHIYESMNKEPGETITGGLMFGKHKFIKDPDIPIEVFDYEDYKDRLSGATKKNLKKLQDLHKSPVKFTKVYKADLSQEGGRFSFYIFGELGDEPFVWARVEPKSFGAGSTKIYFKTDVIGGTKYLTRLERRPTLTPQEDGTYRINDMLSVISYTTEYVEDRLGPELVDYIPKGQYHRMIKPARIHYGDDGIGKNVSKIVTGCEFIENNRERFALRSIPYLNGGILTFNSGGHWTFGANTAPLSHEPIDLNLIAQEDITK
jgi:hypothetical protein